MSALSLALTWRPRGRMILRRLQTWVLFHSHSPGGREVKWYWVGCIYECSFTRTYLEAAKPNDLEAAADISALSIALTWRPRGWMTWAAAEMSALSLALTWRLRGRMILRRVQTWVLFHSHSPGGHEGEWSWGGCRHECSFTRTHLEAAKANYLEAAYEFSFTLTHLEAARLNDTDRLQTWMLFHSHSPGGREGEWSWGGCRHECSFTRTYLEAAKANYLEAAYGFSFTLTHLEAARLNDTDRLQTWVLFHSHSPGGREGEWSWGGCRHECSFTRTYLEAAKANYLEAAYGFSFTLTHLEAARPNDLEAAADAAALVPSEKHRVGNIAWVRFFYLWNQQ
jgi:hypothetical protein